MFKEGYEARYGKQVKEASYPRSQHTKRLADNALAGSRAKTAASSTSTRLCR